MIGKSIDETKPATLAEVLSILEKRYEEAQEELKRLKKEAKKDPQPAPAPVPAPTEAEVAAGAVPAPAPAPSPEEKLPLGLEQRLALEYVKKFAKIGKRNAQELYEKLMKVEGMKVNAAVKLIDLLPPNIDQLKLVLAKERISLNEKHVESVFSLVQDYRK